MSNEYEKYTQIYITLYILAFIGSFVFASLYDSFISFPSESTHTFEISFDFSPIFLIETAFSAIGPSLILITLFNSFFWHIPIIKRVCSINMPYIAGRWEGYIQSTFTKRQVNHKIAIEIVQSLTKIAIWYYDENAITHSIIADITVKNEGGPPQLLCIYENNPITNKDSGLKKHIGVMELYVMSDETKIRGTYFNNPTQKETYGDLFIEFVSRKKKNSFM